MMVGYKLSGLTKKEDTTADVMVPTPLRQKISEVMSPLCKG